VRIEDARRLERLVTVTVKLGRAKSAYEVVRLTAEDGIRAAGGVGGGVAQVNPARGVLAFFPAEITPAVARSMKDALEEKRTLVVALDAGRARVAVPLPVEAGALGALGAEIDADDRDAVPLLELLAEHAAAALEQRERLDAVTRDLRLQREALDRLPMIVWIDRPGEKLEYINDAAPAYTGAESSLSAQHWFDLVHPDDLGRLREALARFEPGSAQYRLRGKGGDYRWFLGQWTTMRAPGGEPQARVGCALDIDAQKMTEEGHRFVAEASEKVASSLDHRTTMEILARLAVPRLGDWCVIDATRSEGSVARVAVEHAPGEDDALAAEILRAVPPRGAIGADPREVLASALPEDDLPPDLAELAAKVGARSALVVYVLGVADETARVALFTARSGRSLGYGDFDLAEELARRTSHALERAHLYAEARRANQAKDAFVGTVSHELRGPLATISMWTHLLGFEHCDDVTRARAAEAIEASVRTQSRLIEDMLDLSRSIAGTLRLDDAPVAIARTVGAAVERARLAAEEKGVSLTYASEVQAVVRGDEARLLQVVESLLTNAVAFTAAGGRIDVTVTRLPEAVRVEVRDTGEGISHDFLPHVFEAFRQEDASLTRARGGLGLGLAVARQLVELHGGTIRAQSAGRGEGALFCIELPLSLDRPRSSPPIA